MTGPKNGGRSGICRGQSRTEYYLTHTIAIDSLPLSREHYQLSLVTDDGEVTRNVSLPTAAIDVWSADFNSDGVDEVFVLSEFGDIEVLSDQFQPVARSNPTTLTSYQTMIPMFADRGPAFVLSNSTGLFVYSNTFEQLLSVPGSYYLEPIELNSASGMTGFLASGGTGLLAGRVSKRSWLDLVAIVYLDYQTYVLSALFTTLVALVLIAFYSRRTRRALAIIRDQKLELETTHRALKDAQSTIIAQEKFRQARDIAGGFAHEIRNALFPARGVLSQVQKKDIPDTARSLILTAEESIASAIRITSSISQYTNLESAVRLERCDLSYVVRTIVSNYANRLPASGIEINLEGDSESFVVANEQHVTVVISNLINNSMDALRSINRPRIQIKWTADDSWVTLRFSDNGAGIRPEHRDRVFDMFFTTKPDTGTGIGLPLSRKIAEMYGGALVLGESTEKGTTFELRLKRWHSTLSQSIDGKAR